MFFQPPPALPPAALIGADQGIEILADCKKGSRDCFPQDRVVVNGESVTTVLLDLNLKTSALTTEFRPESPRPGSHA